MIQTVYWPVVVMFENAILVPSGDQSG